MAMKVMANKRSLLTIENFGIRVAQSIVGGRAIGGRDKRGDLFHPSRQVYSEVKASGMSSGAIIEQIQLQRYLEDGEVDYVIVFYKNRERDKRGKLIYLTLRVGKTRPKLERFLVERTREVFIVHVSVIGAIFKQRMAKDLRTYVMQDGRPKTYLKIPPADLKRLLFGARGFEDLGLNAEHYETSKGSQIAQFGERRFPVTVFRILQKGCLF